MGDLERSGDRRPVTRADLRRELAVNAATKPATIAVPTALVVAGLLLGYGWLFVALAAVAFVALLATTFFDGDEAERIGKQTYAEAKEKRSRAALKARAAEHYAPEIQASLDAAREQQERIRSAIDAADLPFTEVSAEVESLMTEMERIARKAETVYDYLAEQDPNATRSRLRDLRDDARGDSDAARAAGRAADALEAQLALCNTLGDQLERFYAEMEHLAASLGVVHGQLVRMAVAEDAAMQDELAGQVRELRDRVGAVAEGLNAAVSQTP
jgi:predicted  nucleic acid-binding Zn-ribbon protein